MVNFLKVAPSTDPAPNLDDLLLYAKRLNSVADMLHCDVMSANFVGHDTINADVVKQIYARTLLPLDVHLMVNEPLKEVQKYIDAGAQIVTVHYEAFKNKKDLEKCLKKINKAGAMAGIALNPSTEVVDAMPYFAYADLVLLMSVVPGKSGQRFKESTYVKVKKLKQIKDDYGARFKIEVDGGIVPEISKKLKTLGVDIIVSGNYVYASEDRARAINELK
ncbi:MAG: ribulose-phosphate 3-epimerase [Clostridia bacterium]|nr:ribulose-phosphate 3-epimerase [Clostridia bacterium]